MGYRKGYAQKPSLFFGLRHPTACHFLGTIHPGIEFFNHTSGYIPARRPIYLLIIYHPAYKGDGHLGSISAHGKLFMKSYDFNPNCQLDIIKLDLYRSKGKSESKVWLSKCLYNPM